MAVTGRQGMTKAAKKASRLNAMQGNRKREKASLRSHYHSEFKNGREGYPRQGKKKKHGDPGLKRNGAGFLAGPLK